MAVRGRSERYFRRFIYGAMLLIIIPGRVSSVRLNASRGMK